MPDADLPYLSAAEALSLFRSRKLSPVELLDALIDRVEASEPALNAVVDRRYDDFLAADFSSRLPPDGWLAVQFLWSKG